MKIGMSSIHVGKQGGISRYATELSVRFSKEHDMHLVMSEFQYDPKLTNAPIKYYDLMKVKIYPQPLLMKPIIAQIALSTWKYTKVKDILKKRGDIDVFHSQGVECLNPDVFSAHSSHTAAVRQFMGERDWRYRLLKPWEPKSRLICAIEKHNCTKTNCKIISVSEGVKRELMSIWGIPNERITVIPSGVNIEEFNPRNRELYRDKILKEQGILTEKTVLLFVGWEFKRKGLRYIIEALPELPKDVVLLAVGADDPHDYRILAEKLNVSDRLFFAGHSKDVKQYFAAADIFVFPTAYEAYSLATLEAAATGLPLIATKVNGTEELIDEGRNGFFVKRDGHDIAQKVKMAINLQKPMGRLARKKSETYAWDIIANKILKVYEEVKR
jgi:UDP-glucose:(heptosyl)LPS alpha-1,3-glucosyltransferase